MFDEDMDEGNDGKPGEGLAPATPGGERQSYRYLMMGFAAAAAAAITLYDYHRLSSL